MNEEPPFFQNRPDSTETPKLDYFQPRRTARSSIDRLIEKLTPPTDPEQRRWWYRRAFYRVALFSLFAAIAFYFGPNLMLFGQLSRLSASDLSRLVEREGVPVVRAIKLYKLDHGTFPDSIDQLVPRYTTTPGFGSFTPQDQTFIFGGYDEIIEYRFEPAQEGWYVMGPWVNGRLPSPPVTVDPSMRRETRRAD